MSEPSADEPKGGGAATVVLFAAVAAVLGLVSGLPVLVGPALGVAGVLVASVWRGASGGRPGAVTALPALVALAALTAAAPPAPSSELLAGLAGLVFLVWLADDPARLRGGGRRALPTVASAAVGVALAGTIALAVPTQNLGVGVAGGLVALALLLVAVRLAREEGGGAAPRSA